MKDGITQSKIVIFFVSDGVIMQTFSTYHSMIFDLNTRSDLIDRLSQQINKITKPIHGIVACGHGGVIPGSIISYQHNIPLMVIRPSYDKSHHLPVGDYIDGGCEIPDNGPINLVILEDFMESGHTITHILNSLLIFSGDILTPLNILEIIFYQGIQLEMSVYEEVSKKSKYQLMLQNCRAYCLENNGRTSRLQANIYCGLCY